MVKIREDIIQALKDYDEGLAEEVITNVVAVREDRYRNDFYAILWRSNEDLVAIVLNYGEVIDDGVDFDTVEQFNTEPLQDNLF